MVPLRSQACFATIVAMSADPSSLSFSGGFWLQTLYTSDHLSVWLKNAYRIVVSGTCAVISWQHWTVQMFEMIAK